MPELSSSTRDSDRRLNLFPQQPLHLWHEVGSYFRAAGLCHGLTSEGHSLSLLPKACVADPAIKPLSPHPDPPPGAFAQRFHCPLGSDSDVPWPLVSTNTHRLLGSGVTLRSSGVWTGGSKCPEFLCDTSSPTGSQGPTEPKGPEGTRCSVDG